MEELLQTITYHIDYFRHALRRETVNRPWHRPYYMIPYADDVIMLISFALFLTWARITLQEYFVKVARQQHIKEAAKFSESSWKGIYYTSAFVWGMTLLYNCDFFPEVHTCWIDLRIHDEIPFRYRLYYLWQLGFYFHSVYAHYVLEVRRTDFYPLLFHHFATIFLMCYSYITGFYKMGALILIFHDPCDAFFEWGKTLLYKGYTKTTNIMFVFMMATWVLTRLYIFPKWLVHSAVYDSLEIIGPFPYYIVVIPALLFLQVLHFYWFGLMVRMLFRVVFGTEKSLNDSRENRYERKSIVEHS